MNVVLFCSIWITEFCVVFSYFFVCAEYEQFPTLAKDAVLC